MKKIRLLSMAAIILAAVLWGTISVFTRYFNGIGVGATEMISTRAAITILSLLIFLSIYDSSLLKIRLKDLWIFIGTGLFSFTFFNYCYLNSISENSVAVAAILLYTAPIWVTAVSVPVFKDRVDGRKILCLGMVIVGCVMVSLSGNITMTGKGLLLGLGSGLGYALYTIFSRIALNRGYHSLTITFYTFLVVGLCTLPLSDFNSLALIFSSSHSTLMIIGMAFCSMIFPYIFYNMGLKTIKPSVASMVSTIEPVTAAILGWAIFGETLGVISILGIIVVLGAVCLLNAD